MYKYVADKRRQFSLTVAHNEFLAKHRNIFQTEIRWLAVKERCVAKVSAAPWPLNIISK